MNINALPDLCLTEIFSNHSLKQQLTNATICTRWRQVQHKYFRSQKSLTLVIGPKEATRATIRKSSFNWHKSDSLLPKYGSRAFPRPLFNLTKDFLRFDLELIKD